MSQNKSQAQILDELKPPKDKYSNAPFKSKRGKKVLNRLMLQGPVEKFKHQLDI